jgi:hypothetical protein
MVWISLAFRCTHDYIESCAEDDELCMSLFHIKGFFFVILSLSLCYLSIYQYKPDNGLSIL